MEADESRALSAEQKLLLGKSLFVKQGATPEERRQGMQMILQAHKEEHPEATFFVARMILDGLLRPKVENVTEHALRLMCVAANKGCIQARGYLNTYCRERYAANFFADVRSGPLKDFDGKPITVNRTGVFTPVDAVLTYENGRNILTLSTNVHFVYYDAIPRQKHFQKAICEGLQAWEGEYEVFGGQKLSVRVVVTQEDRAFDNLLVMPATESWASMTRAVSNAIGTKNAKEQAEAIFEHKRSFALSGLKWTVSSRKVICIQSEDGCFADYEEIKHVAKHEFGHALGLGDLYASASDNLQGVEKGTFTELDSYAITNRYYNLVMCDHHGPISNNDIEMVVLAFRDNKMQQYQPTKLDGKISVALGKGN